MVEIAELLFSTVRLRPYVFAFLALYLIAASCHLGIKRALLYIPCGYFVAWLSEYSSVHTGIPYGFYRYIQSTAGRELWVLGVPFMDSLSYVFLSYAAYSLARFSSGCLFLRTRLWYPLWPKGSGIVTLLGSFFFVFLDTVIDPVALRGDRWFLGKIYEYPSGGVYFGVPFSNFAGWFFVGLILIGILQMLDPIKSEIKLKGYRSYALALGPFLYFSVLAFNMVITARLGEKLLLTVDLFLTFTLVFLLVFSTLKARKALAASFPTRDVGSLFRRGKLTRM